MRGHPYYKDTFSLQREGGLKEGGVLLYGLIHKALFFLDKFSFNKEDN